MNPEALSDEALATLLAEGHVTLQRLEPTRSELMERVRKFGQLYEALPVKPPGAALLFQSKDSNEVKYLSIDQRVTLGRLPQSFNGTKESILLFSDPEMSRSHFEVEESEGLWIIRDLDSRNGTYVNERPVGSETVILKAGDVISAGSTIFFFTGS